MDIEYLGANCLRITTKKATVFVDPIVPGSKIDTSKAKFSLITNTNLVDYKNGEFVVDTPGEYEISGLSVHGLAAKAHMDEEGESAVIYKIIHDGISLVVVGHIFTKLTDEQLEAIGMVDILVVPVGGNGYTIDSTGAAQLSRKIEPKIVIPVHYNDKGIKYEVPQADLKLFLDEMGAQPDEQEKLKIGNNTILPEQLQVVTLKRV